MLYSQLSMLYSQLNMLYSQLSMLYSQLNMLCSQLNMFCGIKGITWNIFMALFFNYTISGFILTVHCFLGGLRIYTNQNKYGYYFSIKGLNLTRVVKRTTVLYEHLNSLYF